MVPALLSLAHKSQSVGVQVAAVRVVLSVLLVCGDVVVEKVLCGKIREYAERGEKFDAISVAMVEGLAAGLISVGAEGKLAEFWVEIIVRTSAMCAAPCNNGGGAERKSVVKGLVECFGVLCQMGGSGRDGDIVQGINMLLSGGGVATKEGLVLEKMMGVLLKRN